MNRYIWLKDSFPVNILANCLSPSDLVCNLDALFDSNFSFTNDGNHINYVIKYRFANLLGLHHIRHFLSFNVSVIVTNLKILIT